MKEKKNLEKELQKLEEVLEKMDSPTVSLEESLNLYRKGMELYKDCLLELDHYQLEISKLKNPSQVAKGEIPVYENLEDNE